MKLKDMFVRLKEMLASSVTASWSSLRDDFLLHQTSIEEMLDRLFELLSKGDPNNDQSQVCIVFS